MSRIGPVSEETTEFSLILAIGMVSIDDTPIGLHRFLMCTQMLYILGAFINWHSDMLLARLRKPGETGYKIPHGTHCPFVTFPSSIIISHLTGGMFNFVTAANYSGELIEWVGYAIALRGFGGWVWVMLNLGTMAHQARFVFAYSIAYFIPRAHSSHLWYLSKFDSYPQNRKKLIPLVW